MSGRAGVFDRGLLLYGASWRYGNDKELSFVVICRRLLLLHMFMESLTIWGIIVFGECRYPHVIREASALRRSSSLP